MGTYYFGVTTDYLDQIVEAGNARAGAISSQATLIESPELVAESVQPATGSAQFGQPLSVTWTVENGGNAVAATASWSDQLYLSTQATLSSSATLLLTENEGSQSPLAAGDSYTQTAVVTLPLSASSTPGADYLIVKVNASNGLPEGSESNNEASAPITLALPQQPDLVVNNIVVPSQRIGRPGVQRVVERSEQRRGRRQRDVVR